MERSPPFFRTVYPNRNHVTTHPVFAVGISFIVVVEVVVMVMDEVVLTRSVVAVVMRSL